MAELPREGAGRRMLRGTLVLLFWLPILIGLLNYGAVEIQAVVLMIVPVFTMIVAVSIIGGISESTRPAMVSAVVLLVMTFCWVALQVTPLPSGLLAQPAWQDVAGMSVHGAAGMSLTPGDDWPSVLRVALPFGVFMLSLLLFDTDDRAVGAVRVLAVSGGIVSILSILQFEIAPDTLLFWSKIAYADSLTGFFVNRNTAATYFGLIVLLNLAFLLRALGDPGVGLADLRRWWYRERKLPALGYAFWLSASLIALMLTKSRAGLLSSVIAITCLLVLRLFRRSRGRRMGQPFTKPRIAPWLKRSLQLAAVVLILLFVLQMLGGRTLLRAETQGLGDSRYCVMPGILSAIVNHFPWGSGLASFEDVFPGYRDPACGLFGMWNRAHNVYLEGVFTLGLIFVLMTAVALLMLVRFFVIGLRQRRGLRFAPEIGLSALSLVAFHSAFDFSLQISGMAVIVAALLAPLVTISLNPPGKSSSAG
ncbi:O-antigen ligase family protein [Neorhizobium sp. LMR1-1-1.1]